MWYCGGTSTTDCGCVWRMLHEVSHSCGTLDLDDGSNYDSYRIGDWFENEYKSSLSGSCRVSTIATEPDVAPN